jgi:hypothetical protein
MQNQQKLIRVKEKKNRASDAFLFVYSYSTRKIGFVVKEEYVKKKTRHDNPKKRYEKKKKWLYKRQREG